MIAENKHRTSIRLAMPVVVLIAVSFVISVPGKVSAQSTWSDALVSFLARLRMAQETKSGVQSKTGGKGDVTIQTITAGKIAKFTDVNGTIGDSVIAESSGWVGIGTTTPSQRVEVFQNLVGNLRLQVTNTSTDAGSTAGIRLSSGNTGNDAVIWEQPANKLDYGGADSLNIYKVGNTPIAFLTNDAVRLFVKGDGNIGIGTQAPLARLDVRFDGAYAFPTPGLNTGSLHIVPTTGTKNNSAAITFGANDGNLGIDVRTDAQAGIYVQSSGDYGTKMYFATSNSYGVGSQARVLIDPAGNVGIGTTVPTAKLHVAGGDVSVTGAGSVSLTATGNITNSGNITATGTISGGNVIARYQDVAEWVPARNAMPAGTVVTLDPEHSNLVVASSHSYDTRVAGVVSERPGVILGEGGEGKVMVATTGRVRVKVDATNGPIRVGDLLVTSDKEGIAMRSQPLDLGGTPIHRPGTLIGKALEPLEKGVGEILVLLSLQ